jgi:hypothetical protein
MTLRSADVELRVQLRSGEVWATVRFTNSNARDDALLDPYALATTPMRDLFTIEGASGRAPYIGRVARVQPCPPARMMTLKPRATHTVQVRIDTLYRLDDAVAAYRIRYAAWHGAADPPTAWHAASDWLDFTRRPPLRIDRAVQERALAQAKAQADKDQVAEAVVRAHAQATRAATLANVTAQRDAQAARQKQQDAARLAEAQKQRELQATAERIRQQAAAAKQREQVKARQAAIAAAKKVR